MQNVLEQGPDFWCWFDKSRFSCHCVHTVHACKDGFFSIQMLLYTFQSNCAKGLHFSAFHLKCFLFLFRYFFVIKLYVIIFSRSINTHTGDYGRPTAAIRRAAQNVSYAKKHTQTNASYPATDISCMPSRGGV